jgi:hypothetical protein
MVCSKDVVRSVLELLINYSGSREQQNTRSGRAKIK